ncbi:MAG: hypothetical protein K2L34_02925, partial [Muribaculaceae bacterium]|nr:hypothetical protein [Muribaculaceae bacterium]
RCLSEKIQKLRYFFYAGSIIGRLTEALQIDWLWLNPDSIMAKLAAWFPDSSGRIDEYAR